MSQKQKPAAELGYAEALEELEGILHELEGDHVDVDRLTERVTRARALIARCRELSPLPCRPRFRR